MESEDTERLVAEIDPDLKELVKADQRTIKEIVEAALWREFGGTRKSALERRIEEKKRRVSMVESEKNERERELQQEREELEALRQKYNSTETQAQRVAREAFDVIGGPISDVQAEHWADKADMSVEEFKEEYKEARQ